jgi:hypothetical protein
VRDAVTAPADTERVVTLMRQLHRRQGRWKPGRCGCAKNGYGSEERALAAAEKYGELYGPDFRVYKCPGSSSWHLRTRGFTPAALRSRPRIMAWHLTSRGATTPDFLLDALGLPPYSDDRGARRKIVQVRTILDVFAELGLVTADDPHPPYVSVASREGLLRVMMTGLDEYVRALGISWTE